MNLELVFWIILFSIGYVVIYVFADYIIDLLEDFSDVYTISPVIVGLFILGVDLEESIVSLIAASSGFPYLALGNLIGNTIIAATIAFGLPALFLKFEFQQIPLVYYGLLLLGGLSITISMIVPHYLLLFAVINLGIFGTYVINSVKVQNTYRECVSTKESLDQINALMPTDEDEGEEERNPLMVVKIVLSLVIIFIGGEILVTSAEHLVLLAGVAETFFGLIIMAFVTNVEEFWLIVKAIQKGLTELGISAQLGKILWNTTLIFGICGLLIIQLELEAIMVFSAILCFFIVALLVFNLVRKNLSPATGVLYFAIFLLFVGLNLSFLR